MTRPETGQHQSGWERIIGFFIDRKLLVVAIVLLVVGSGFYVAPFDWDVAGLPRDRVPVDAIPDIGENQQIVFTEWPGRSPRDVEDQVTYPLTTALLGMPGVRTVRSFSMLGFSTIYVIFEDGVEQYWSRSRVLEKLSALPEGTLPDGLSPSLGPDATALGQVFWYTLEGRDSEGNPSAGFELDELRSIQDWTVRYALQGVPGVAEVASVGGFVREYQVDVDPEAMLAHGVRLDQVAGAVRASNLDVGARTLEINRTEYIVRGVGFVESVEDLEEAVVAMGGHVPIRVRDVARVGLGPAARRGALDVAGAEAVGGVVVVRYGENPLEVIEAVHERIRELTPGLPSRTLEDGTVSQLTIVPFYDRTGLIEETLGTLSTALIQQILITIIVVLLMIRNLPSSAVISAMLPLAVLGSFVAMKLSGVDANVMSLAGIAIAIGTMVDMAIVFMESIVAALEGLPEGESRRVAVRRAAAEVAPAVLTSAATTVVSFLPVFALTASEGRLFRPVAFTKTYALVASALLAVAVLPAFAHLVIGRSTRAFGVPRSGIVAVLRALARPASGRDWVLVAAGAVVAIWVSPLAGSFVAALGLLRLVAVLLPDRMARFHPWVESSLAVIAVGALLTSHWMPLGQELGLARNLVFVGGLIALVMVAFAFFLRGYPFILGWVLEHKGTFFVLPGILLLFGLSSWLGFDRLFGWMPERARLSGPAVTLRHAFPGLGREFMPPFDEGSFLYMPTTMPHASFGQALEMLQRMDAAIAAIPEIDTVVGKLGRADSPLDPAPISMFETVIVYRPEYGVDEQGERVRLWRDHIRSPDDIWQEIVDAAQMPGLTSAPMLQPISTRIVMLQSGIRAPLGLRIRGPDLETIEAVGLRVEELLKRVPSIRPETVFADRIVGKPYVEIDIDREAIARHGLTVEAVQRVITIALGGETLTRTVEGRERYAVRVRYMREERDSIEALGRIFVPVPVTAADDEQHQIPLGQLTTIRYVRGPQVIRSEDTFPTGYVIFDRRPDVSEVEVVEQARAYLEQMIADGELELPDGVPFPTFTGTYENQVRSEDRLKVLVPLALLVIFVILYLQFRSPGTTLVIYTGVAVALSGGFILVWLYGQPWFLGFSIMGVDMRELFQVGTVNLSVAVWVGFIALLGIATDDGVVIATYLQQRFSRGTPPATVAEVRARVVEAGKKRIRPALMTTATTILALIPVITSQGRGSDVMAPMAIPALGGMTIELVTLFVVPALYSLVEELRLRRKGTA